MKNENSSVEKSVRKSQEAYREMLKTARDPTSQEIKFPYRLRVPKKYWENDLAELTPEERAVYLHYRIHANWQTGEAILGVRKMATLLKMNKDTVLKVRQNLVQKGFLEKTRKAVRCWYYKILKV